ncbi:hypothetical protein [Paracoccus sp. (in: a-proteobacteria)]|uniref:hypothetical protein n=1 Tax=Paracoccus sp. TaxID=267 RepID=UPI00396CBCB3
MTPSSDNLHSGPLGPKWETDLSDDQVDQRLAELRDAMNNDPVSDTVRQLAFRLAVALSGPQTASGDTAPALPQAPPRDRDPEADRF